MLRVLIKQKITDATTDQSANQIITWLSAAGGKKQAEAVVNNTTLRKQIEDLYKYGFSNIANNSAQAVQAALLAAPAGIAAANQATLVQAQLNTRINGYLASISNKYGTHRTGTNHPLPINDVVGTKVTAIARHYNNGEGKLPPGANYVEWYPLIGSVRSTEKRFFTQLGNTNFIWYTEGGTHGSATQVWYRRVGNATDWQPF